jgi:phosphate/sulfate permease
VWAWLITIPASAVMAAATYSFIRIFLRQA